MKISEKNKIKYIAVYEVVIFIVLLILNISAPKFFRSNYIAVETIGIMIVAFITITLTLKTIKRVIFLEEFTRICAWCKRVHINGTWVSIENMLDKNVKNASTHGICTDCVKTLKKDFTDVRSRTS